MPKLTKRFVEATIVKDKPYFIFDEFIPGFCLRVSQKGKRHYYFQYMKNKVRKRVFIGQHGVITSEQAREEAISKLNDVKTGKDPHLDNTNKKSEPLVGDVASRFVDEYVKLYCKSKTQKEYIRYLNCNILPFLKNIKISDLTHADVASLHASLQKTPCSANHCITTLSKLCNLAEKWGLRNSGSNPCKHVEKFSIKSRERYLTKEETKKLGIVLDEVKQYPDENLAAAYCIQLLLLTGCRLGEIQTLKWDYIDYDNELIKLPDSKTGAKTVYVGDAVIHLLKEIKNHHRRPKDNPYVIWGRNPGAYLNNMQKPWKRFRKLAGLDDVRMHDLRHSFASFAINRGMSLPTIGKLLGHAKPQTTARYAHFMAKTMKEAANTITSEVSCLLNINNASTKEYLNKNQKINEYISGTAIDKPVYLTSEQAAEYLGVKHRLMEYWRWRNSGPVFIRVGGRIRYKLDDLEAFIASKAKALGAIHSAPIEPLQT